MEEREILSVVRSKMAGGELTVPITDLALQLGIESAELQQMIERWRRGEFARDCKPWGAGTTRT